MELVIFKNEDMERIECKKVGKINHYFCGFCLKHDVPRFRCGCFVQIGITKIQYSTMGMSFLCRKQRSGVFMGIRKGENIKVKWDNKKTISSFDPKYIEFQIIKKSEIQREAGWLGEKMREAAKKGWKTRRRRPTV